MGLGSQILSIEKIEEVDRMFDFRNYKSKVMTCGAVVVVLLLGGCRSDFYIDVYASDLFLDENMDTPAQMMVEIPTCDSRAEYEPKILALFDSQSKAKVTGCEEQGMNSMLLVNVVAEITDQESTRDIVLFRKKYDDVEHDSKSYQVRGVSPVINTNFFSRVDSLMQESMQTLSYNDITIRFSVNNDLRSTILVSTNLAWVDGTPHERYFRRPLERRQNLDLRLSDVSSDLILQNKQPLAFNLYLEQN